MKWLLLPTKDIPPRMVRTVTVYALDERAGVFLIKRRDMKRNKLWVIPQTD